MLHDYHLYLAPAAIRQRAAGRAGQPLHPHPVAAVVAVADDHAAIRTAIVRGLAAS